MPLESVIVVGEESVDRFVLKPTSVLGSGFPLKRMSAVIVDVAFEPAGMVF